MANNYKILFAGPVGAGKTTAITSISDIPPVRTDEDASDMTLDRKTQTTVAMDYGLMNIGEGERVHLYGTPGQERFNFMWDILTEGSIGMVLLLDNTRNDPFKDLQFFLRSFKSFSDAGALVIGITRSDLKSQPMLSRYQEHLHELNVKAPVFEVDARRREDISTLIQALLYSLDPGLTEHV